ncbi:glycosyltransferase [Tabrizicola sp.]|uniref:glycosyltransferase n=1 Tax=Tabrizicola sp. TaxID=2005166 RepID=UPI003F662A44
MLDDSSEADEAEAAASVPVPELSAPIPVLALTKSTGGLAIYHRTLVAGLSPDLFSIHTLCLSDNAASFAAELERLGHTAEAVPMARYRVDLWGDVRVAWLAARVARARGARVILCHGSKPGMIGRAVGWMLGIPVVYCQASLPFLPRVQGREAGVYRMIERSARLFGSHIVALTEGARALSLQHGIATPDRISVIRSGIDAKRYASQGRRAEVRQALGLDQAAQVVLWMGRFEAQKAPEVFLDAVEVLCARLPQAQVIIVGEGSKQAAVEAKVEASPYRGRIRLLPWQPDPARLMEAADVLCLSSRWEGLPLVLLEAMAIGAVPVSTAVDGCAEVIEDRRSGRLVPPDDAAALAAALIETLSDSEGLARMSKAAVERVRRDFTVGRMMAEWQATLVGLAGRKGR